MLTTKEKTDALGGLIGIILIVVFLYSSCTKASVGCANDFPAHRV